MNSHGSVALIDAAATIILLTASIAIALHYSALLFSDGNSLPYQVERCAAQKVGEAFLLKVIEEAGHLALVENPYFFKKILSNFLEKNPPPPGVVLALKAGKTVMCEWGSLQSSEVLASVSMTFSTREGLVEVTCYVSEAAIKS